METIILIVHLIIALFLIAVVLLQRSEGGALGIGGGGGGMMSSRGTANALTKATWGLGTAFIATSMMLTILAVRGTQDVTVVVPPSGDGSIDILIPDALNIPDRPSPDSPLVPPSQDP